MRVRALLISTGMCVDYNYADHLGTARKVSVYTSTIIIFQPLLDSSAGIYGSRCNFIFEVDLSGD